MKICKIYQGFIIGCPISRSKELCSVSSFIYDKLEDKVLGKKHALA